MNYDMKECGNRIWHLRSQRGYTQEDFARMLNVDRSNLSRIESGKRSRSLDLLIQISELFGITLNYLILGISNPRTLPIEEKARLKKYIAGLIEQLERFRASF